VWSNAVNAIPSTASSLWTATEETEFPVMLHRGNETLRLPIDSRQMRPAVPVEGWRMVKNDVPVAKNVHVGLIREGPLRRVTFQTVAYALTSLV
jgi:hypothetical protein